MKLKLRGAAAVAALCFTGLTVPAAAVSFGSNDGTSWGNDTVRYSNGFAASGQIKPYSSGHKLYWQGKIIYNWSSDEDCGRFTPNVSGTTSWTWTSGTCVTYHQYGADHGKLRLAKDQWGWDPRGSWSRRIF